MQCSIKDIGRDDTLCSSLDRCSSAWRNPFPKVYTSESTVRPKDLYRLVALSCIIDDIINRKSRNWLCGRFGRNCFYSGANLSDGRIVRFTNPLSIVIWTQIEWLWCESMTVQCPPPNLSMTRFTQREIRTRICAQLPRGLSNILSSFPRRLGVSTCGLMTCL